MSTVFDVCNWNVASPRWYTPWAPRAAGIGKEIQGEASVYGFQEIYAEDQAATVQSALGSAFRRVSGHAGLEFFYDATKWKLDRSANYSSGIQGRCALVVHLIRKDTKQHVAFLVTHAPALYPSLREKFGQWLGKLIVQIDGPLVVMGDFNTGKDNLSPRANVRARGYRDMRDQAKIVNGREPEFPNKKSSLADIFTIPSKARIISGEIDLTAARLSDHRRLEVRIVI